MKAKRTNQPLGENPIHKTSPIKPSAADCAAGTHRARRCARCGCTETRCCPGGCAWVGETNLCTRCLTRAEQNLWASLRGDLLQKADALDLVILEHNHADQQLQNFEIMLMQKPIQRRKRHA